MLEGRVASVLPPRSLELDKIRALVEQGELGKARNLARDVFVGRAWQ